MIIIGKQKAAEKKVKSCKSSLEFMLKSGVYNNQKSISTSVVRKAFVNLLKTLEE